MKFKWDQWQDKKWRKSMYRYWLRDPFWGGLSYVCHFIFRYLPIPLNAAIGRLLGSLVGKYWYKSVNDRILQNIEILRPDLSPEAREEIAVKLWQNLGQGRGEYSILDKLSHQGNVTVTNLDNLQSLIEKKVPIILVFAHTGNWEIRAKYLIELGLNPLFLYQPEKNRFITDIAIRARSRMFDSKHLLEATPKAMRIIGEHLANGNALWIALDEFKKGHVQSPSFGRQLLLKGSNLSYVARLAQQHNAVILPVWSLRKPGPSYSITLGSPMAVSKNENAVAETITKLDELLEKHILNNLDQWYMLLFLRMDKADG